MSLQFVVNCRVDTPGVLTRLIHIRQGFTSTCGSCGFIRACCASYLLFYVGLNEVAHLCVEWLYALQSLFVLLAC